MRGRTQRIRMVGYEASKILTGFASILANICGFRKGNRKLLMLRKESIIFFRIPAWTKHTANKTLHQGLPRNAQRSLDPRHIWQAAALVLVGTMPWDLKSKK